jgi:hypothetical protein
VTNVTEVDNIKKYNQSVGSRGTGLSESPRNVPCHDVAIEVAGTDQREAPPMDHRQRET